MSEQLKPCPFCGSEKILQASSGYDTYYYMCDGCGAEGPAWNSIRGARGAWNVRTTPRADSPPPSMTPGPKYDDDYRERKG